MFVNKDRKKIAPKSKPLEAYTSEELLKLIKRKRALYDNPGLRDSLPDKGSHILATIKLIEKILKDRETKPSPVATPSRLEKITIASDTLENQLQGMTLKDNQSTSTSAKQDHIPVREIPNPFVRVREPTAEELRKKEKASRDRDELIHGKRGMKLREQRNVRSIRVLTTEESLKLYEERKREEHEQMIREARERLMKAPLAPTLAPVSATPLTAAGGAHRNSNSNDSDSDEDAVDRFDEIELPADDEDDEEENTSAVLSDHD